MFNFSKKNIKKMDYILVLALTILIIFGILVLNSAITPSGGNVSSQIRATLIGIVAGLIVFTIDLDFFYKIKWIVYIFSVGLVTSTLFFGYGSEEWGANLWLKIGPLNLQPSEISKVLHLIFLSTFLGENKKKINTPKFIISYIILAYALPALIVLQGDIGTALVVAFISTAMLFVSGLSWKNIGILVGVLLVLIILTLPFVWKNLAGYAKDRITDFQDKSRDLTTSTHQTDRGIIALGSGQLYGRGYMKGPFSQNRYIPEQHTDFIFPVLVEDFGFIGGMATILLYFTMFSRLIKIALEADQLYHTTFVIGVLAMLFVHIFENIGMTMQIMPVTGIPLPFFSHGGTFQIMNIVLMSIVLSISMHRKSLNF